MRPFLKDITWTPRPVKSPGPREEQQKSPRRGSSPSVVSPELETTRTVIDQFRQDALKRLNDHLHLPADTLPQTREAVRTLTDGSDTVLTGDVLDRAFKVLDHADRLMFGFDIADILAPDFDGKVRPYGPVTTAAQAAGEAEIPRLDEKVDLSEVIEGRNQIVKRDLFYRTFLATVFFLLRLLGDVLKGIGDKVANILSIRILGRRIRVGKWIAKPFWWLAKKLFRLADRLEDKAMGYDPADEVGHPWDGGAPPPPDVDINPGSSDPDDINNDTNSDVYLEDSDELTYEIPQDDQVTLPSSHTTRHAGASGVEYLMAAGVVITAVQREAARPERDGLRDAISRYLLAREASAYVQVLAPLQQSVLSPDTEIAEETDACA